MRLNKEGERGAGASPYLSVVVGRGGRPLCARSRAGGCGGVGVVREHSCAQVAGV